MNRLCRLIQEEKDPAKFAQLVDQLIALLDRRELQLESSKPRPS
jgi:hypothetical protein